MDIFKIIKEAFNFFSSQWRFMLVITFPWLVLETSAQTWVMLQFQNTDPETMKITPSQLIAILSALVCWNYMYACLTLFMHERSQNIHVSALSIWLRAWHYVPYLMVAAALSGTAIMIMTIPAAVTGFFPLLLLSLWVAIRLAYVNFFIVIEKYTPLRAVKACAQFTEGLFTPTATAFLFLFTIASLSGTIGREIQDLPVILHIIVDSLFGFVTLFVTVILFRIYMIQRTSHPSAQTHQAEHSSTSNIEDEDS
tara:strand:+ start:2430 stop:3188 length:759 start_codon:yes stop_codon:yes gene_type:complete